MNPETGEIEPKVHLHWRSESANSTKAEHELLKEARTLATNLVGGDKTNKSVVHPIRWPGSWHRKKTPRLAKIVASSDNEIDLNEALEDPARGNRQRFSAVPQPQVPDGAPLRLRRLRLPQAQQAPCPRRRAVTSALAVIPNDSELTDEKGNHPRLELLERDGHEDLGRDRRLGSRPRRVSRMVGQSQKDTTRLATDARWDCTTRRRRRRRSGSAVWSIWRASTRQDGPTETPADQPEPTRQADCRSCQMPALPTRSTPSTCGPSSIRQLCLVGLLPGVIEDFAIDRGRTMGCDISGFAVGALAVCAGAIPQDIKLQPKKNDTEWQEAPRLWVMLVGDPSHDEDARMLRDHQSRCSTSITGWRTTIRRPWKNGLRLPKEDQKKTPKPKKLRAMIFDTTIESVAGDPQGQSQRRTAGRRRTERLV